MDLTRRDLLKGAAALGAAAGVPLTAGRAAQAQTTQKKELVVAQGGWGGLVYGALDSAKRKSPGFAILGDPG